MKTGILTFTLFAAVALGAPAAAHHSAAQYDREAEMIVVTGEVTEYQWTNPHTWIYIRAMGADGQPQEWALEGESVGQYVRLGWTAESVELGDVVEAHIWPLKDGSYGGQLGYLVRADGVILGEVPE